MSDLVERARRGAAADGPERIGTVERNTTETKISLRLNVDGTGQYTVSPASGSSTTCWSCLRGTAGST